MNLTKINIMTDRIKIYYKSLPINVWIIRKYDWQNEKQLMWCISHKIIALEFRNGVQWMRRKTIDEIQEERYGRKNIGCFCCANTLTEAEHKVGNYCNKCK